MEAASENVEASIITMLDVLEQEKEKEEEYAAVLGGSDEKCCTFVLGKVQRQALYSCLTCCPESANDLEKCAGICLACSLSCHDGHELVELYTKRNFRCDCPTERLEGHRCLLNDNAEKAAKNTDNLYNQNFQGLYCNCHRPYPDPERTEEELMLQCAVCEDWFHLQHLQAPPTAAKLLESCGEMICDTCMDKHAFLKDYTGLALKALEDLNETVSGDVSICETADDNKLHSELDKSISDIMGGEEAEAQAKVANEAAKHKLEENSNTNEEPNTKKPKMDNELEATKVAVNAFEIKKCKRPIDVKTDYEKGATFWGLDWRLALCKCETCMQMYAEQNIEYLLDPEDSAKSYEELGMKRVGTESSYEQGMRALASIGRVQQVEAITEYNRMKDKLKEYLQTFAVSKKVVTEEDINRFFQEMRNEKNAHVGQPYFCR